jgi:hypothetical protein
LLLPLLLLAAFAPGCGERPGPEELSLHRNVTSAEGWQGRATFVNGKLVAEEYDAMGADGRYDLWRYYEAGRILSAERDRDADDRIDYEAEYDPATGALVAFRRDTNFDGRLDLGVRYREEGFWVETRDRDHDGEPDRFFAFEAPPTLFTDGAADPLEAVDLQETLPPAAWSELVADTDGDGMLDQWVRYREGAPYQVGVDGDSDGRPERWVDVGRPLAQAEGVPEIGGPEGRAEAPAPTGGRIVPAEAEPEPVVIRPVVLPEDRTAARTEPRPLEPEEPEPLSTEEAMEALSRETRPPGVSVEPVRPVSPAGSGTAREVGDVDVEGAGVEGVNVEEATPPDVEPEESDVGEVEPVEPFRHPSEGLME